MDEKTATDWRIVEEQSAPEDLSLPGCVFAGRQEQQQEKPEPALNRSQEAATAGIGSFVRVLLLSSLLSLGAVCFATFSCDWGREVLEEFAGDQPFIPQQIIAYLAIVWVFFPTVLGAIFGGLSRAAKGRAWWIAGPLVLSLVASIWSLFRFFLPVGETIDYSLLVINGGPWLAAGLAGCLAAYKLGGAAYTALSKRQPPRAALLPALVYLLPSGLLMLMNWDGNFGFKEEVIVFNSLVFVAAALSAYRCRMKTAAAGLTAALFVTMPVLLWNFINLTVTAVTTKLFGMPQGMEAICSASIIALCTTLASVAGGITGFKIHSNKLP